MNTLHTQILDILRPYILSICSRNNATLLKVERRPGLDHTFYIQKGGKIGQFTLTREDIDLKAEELVEMIHRALKDLFSEYNMLYAQEELEQVKEQEIRRLCSL